MPRRPQAVSRHHSREHRRAGNHGEKAGAKNRRIGQRAARPRGEKVEAEGNGGDRGRLLQQKPCRYQRTGDRSGLGQRL